MLQVRSSTDAADVLDRAGAFLRTEPVLHNLVLTLLHDRAASGEPGRYWWVDDAGATVGLVFQSLLDYAATLTPMPGDAVPTVVRAIDVELPGVHGEAATTARFAGEWAEHRRTAAVPSGGLRVYEAATVSAPANVAGRLRAAAAADRALLVEWVHAFHVEIGEGGGPHAEGFVDDRMAAGGLWVWDDEGVVSMAAATAPVEGVARVHAVYTPPARRGAGYAGACVAAVSQRLLAHGTRPMLYTDLGNPVSNSVYRRIGYRAVAECLRYRFD